MGGVDVRSFDKPDETRQFTNKGYADVVQVGGHNVARSVYEPGWRWSTHVKPIAKTELCEISHLVFALEGRMRVHMKDGSEREITAGEIAAVQPGHDAEVVGGEPCVLLDFGEIEKYALQR